MIINFIFFLVFRLVGFVNNINIMGYLMYLIVFLIVFFIFSYSEIFFLNSYFLYDSIRLSLVVLRLWVSLLIVFSRFKIYRFDENKKYFFFFVYLLLLVLIVSFFCGGYLYFYFFFEVSLIPTLLIIIGWGYQPERLQAGLYFLFYTLTASLPLLILLLYLFVNLGTLSFFYVGPLFTEVWGVSVLFIIGFIGAMAFLVKLPIYFTHLWLPKAHVEAPVAGSIILAGVLLKLGGYGLIRLLGITRNYIKVLGPYFIGLSLVGIVYVGFICCRINDFKALVAYSSVAHIGMVICGLITLTV
jgi:NADH-ubiquinone oxidoreductase chain 4